MSIHMKIFFKSFLASLLALFVFTIVGIMLLFGIAAAVSNEEPKTIPSNAVLVLDISQAFPEQSNSDPLTEILSKKKGKLPSPYLA